MTTALAVWGAILSTAVAIFQILEYRLRLSRQLRVFAATDSPFEVLDIEVVNAGPRPATLKEILVVYGATAESGQLVDIITVRLPQKLEESDAWTISLDRRRLVDAAQHGVVQQRYFHRVWVVARTTIGRTLATPVRIPASIISEEYYLPAGPWIAADMFLGFERMASKIEQPPAGGLLS